MKRLCGEKGEHEQGRERKGEREEGERKIREREGEEDMDRWGTGESGLCDTPVRLPVIYH